MEQNLQLSKNHVILQILQLLFQKRKNMANEKENKVKENSD